MSGLQVTSGRILLTLSALANAIGPYAADWSTTHVFNPRWPPHAKFHNGQTMSMGLGLGLSSLYYTWASNGSRDATFTAALLGSLYWLTGLSAILYPGTAGVDPEFGKGFPQAPLFSAFFAMAWAGYGLEVARLKG